MSIGVMNFPILSPEQANPLGNSFINSLKAMIEARNQRAQAQAQEAKNPYISQLTQQELLKQKLYNQFYGSDMQSQIGLRGAQAGLAQSEAAKNNFLRKNPAYINIDAYAATKSPSFNGQAGDNQQGIAQPGQGGQPQAQQAPQASPGGNSPIMGRSGGPETSTSQYPGNLPGNGFQSTGSSLLDGRLAQHFMSPQQKIAMEIFGKAQSAQADQNIKSFADNSEKASEVANMAPEALNNLSQFSENYDKSTFKGPKLGMVHSAGMLSPPLVNMTPEQLTDHTSNQLQVQFAKALGVNKLTNYELGFAGKSVPTRMLEKDAKEQVVPFMEAKIKRAAEKLPFLSYLQSQSPYGLPPSQSVIDSAWNAYNTQRPVFDFKEGKANTQNLDSWHTFITPQRLQAIQKGQSLPDTNKPEKMATVISPDGRQKIQLPESQVSRLLKDHPGHKRIS